MPTRTSLDCDDVFEKNLVREIEGQGWSVVHSTDRTLLAYTVGLSARWDHPECLVFGLHPEKSQALLRLVCEEVKKGSKFGCAQSYPGLVEEYSCRFQVLSPQFYREYLGYCRWYYRGDRFQAVQLMWPDLQGNFPDEASFDPHLMAHQPALVG